MAGTFWNISNHPHVPGPENPGWFPDQIDAAESWGLVKSLSHKLVIQDVPFPDVAPWMDTQEIQVMADVVLDRLMPLALPKRLDSSWCNSLLVAYRCPKRARHQNRRPAFTSLARNQQTSSTTLGITPPPRSGVMSSTSRLKVSAEKAV